MATRTAQTTDQGLKPLRGLKHETIHYSDIDDAETVLPGSTSMVRVAFEPDDLNDDINVVLLSPSIISFQAGAGSAHSGTVHIWSAGY